TKTTAAAAETMKTKKVGDGKLWNGVAAGESSGGGCKGGLATAAAAETIRPPRS
uniref:Uncharacterized protein n=1 Tax=Globodera pallida TaxID=36090 RepID=A0A183CTJ1_GLOPA